MIGRIVNDGFCVGCGLCESIYGSDNCQMKLFTDGFYYPVKKTVFNDKGLKHLCPGIRVNDNRKHGIWGYVEKVEEAWSTDNTLRYKAASGGVSSALALYLLESKKVDGILQTGIMEGSSIYNELKVSHNREDIFNNAQSRYAPSLTLSRIKQVLDSSDEIYAYIGKPCDIAGIRSFLLAYPQYKERIKYTISIFCAGMPNYNATQKVYEQSGKTEEPISIKYRGEGWPGNFKAVWKDGTKFETSYNDSWGKVLGRNLGFRCKICPDGIGMLADIAVGDSWNTKNGYPDFTEADGRNFCFLRSQNGLQLFNDALKAGYIECRELDAEKVKYMQAYQYDRRHMVPWRVLAANVFSGFLLHFRGLGLLNLMLKSNKKRGMKELYGTVKRFIKNKYSMYIIIKTGGVFAKARTNYTLVSTPLNIKAA